MLFFSARQLYWRTYADHSLQRARLGDLDLDGSGGFTRRLHLINALPWFTDAASAFAPFTPL